MKTFFRLTKVDEARREVWGRATEEVVDRSNEIFDYETSKPLFQKWSAGFAEATDGKSLGNIRSMHGKVAAGKVIQIDFQDTEKAIDIGTKIIDDNEWEKVLEGVHTGFSIGGNYVGKKWKDEPTGAMRYTADPNEISLVDSPCLQTAKFFDVIKADGTTIQKAFVAKGMGHVADLAWTLKSIAWLTEDQVNEAAREGDASPVPAKLKAWLAAGAAILTQMTEEETAELVTALPEVPDDAFAMADPTGDLAKKGARHSAADKDHLQAIHDHAASMGADCDASKAEPAGDLAKVQGLTDELAKANDTITELTTKTETLTKRVLELEAQPEPPRSAIADLPGVVLGKGDDNRREDANQEEAVKKIETMPEGAEKAKALIQLIHSGVQVKA